MSCGCGEANERHKDGDITYQDLERAAANAQIDPERAADNIHQSARAMRSGAAGETS